MPYRLNWESSFIKYGIWLAEPRTPEWFARISKIVVREITAKGRIYAAFIEEEFVFSNSVDGIRSRTNNKQHLLQLLGILNSKFAAYYHLKSSSNSQKDSFPKLLIQNLRDFPFPSEINYNLIKEIERIIELKKVNPYKETSDIEKAIDQLIYESYGLTNEE